MRQFAFILFVFVVLSSFAAAKDQPFQVISWPDSGQPVVRFTFSKFNGLGSGVGKERTYITDVTAENLSDKTIVATTFSLYVFDKSKARVGEGYIHLNNVAGHETVKFQVTIAVSGSPSSLAIAPDTAAARSVSITVNSVPQGASLTLDGKAIGQTPRLIDMSIGKHFLEFQKDGFNPGKFPLEISSQDASGGSVSYELGAAAHDTIELRDGSILSGDLITVSGMQVEIRIGGNMQTIDRNQVKRILFAERLPASN